MPKTTKILIPNNNRLYPEILFHFTSWEGLKGILANNFEISYARERIVAKGDEKKFGAPMVSFCDLRLSELKSHMGKYGKYGIGLTKDWAKKKGLNPVFYVSQDCQSTADFVSAVEGLYTHVKEIVDGEAYSKLLFAYMNILNMYRYIKNYDGDLIREGMETIPNYRFADEREWRYVPPLNEHDLPFVPSSSLSTAEQKAALNARFLEHKLTFNPEDIRYLIVDNDSERLDLINHLELAKSRFDRDTRRRLASRILTAEQIENDV